MTKVDITGGTGTLRAGPQLDRGWTVYTVWRPTKDTRGFESAKMFHDWPTARREALSLSCLRGVSSVTVVDPHHIVAGDIEGSSGNYWREYRLPVGGCDNYLEREDRPCPGTLYARPADQAVQQIQCPVCRAWTGIRAPGIRWPFDRAVP